MNFQTKILLPLFTFLFFTNSIFAQQPNVLLIIVDDIGVGPIPNYEPNSTKANMPHLEAMMNDSHNGTNEQCALYLPNPPHAIATTSLVGSAVSIHRFCGEIGAILKP